MNSIEHNSEVEGEPEAVSTPESQARNRRRLLWSIGVIAVLLVLLLTPPLLNVNRLRLRIADSMSTALGRPVHLDKVTLHVLPVPGFTLENLVVSEDPAFGNEPVIRAMKVELTPRLSSLWRRQVEISTIRFEVDDNGSAPSLNLVRNAQGKWNVQSLLMHAAQVNAEPTAQTSAGPAPRFPYIEATGGRVNLKLGDEKQPFSLLDADFALWLPTPESWHVRLEGKPTRTDTNASDTGTVTLEGKLQRAAKMGDVPVDLKAAWHNAPLGEASKLITGKDAGWRGTLMVDASLVGALNSAKLSTQVHLNDLRRADFVPEKTLNVKVDCEGALDLPEATIVQPSCVLPTDVAPSRSLLPTATPAPLSQITAVATAVDLSKLQEQGNGFTGLQIGMVHTEAGWLLDWARLFSQRIPKGESPKGLFAGTMTLMPAAGGAPSGWQGEFQGSLATTVKRSATSPGAEAADDPGLPLVVRSQSSPDGQVQFVLEPVNLGEVDAMPAVTLSGEASMLSYSLHLAGTATLQQLQSLRGMMPVLGDGMEQAVPELLPAPSVAGDAAKPAVERPLKLNVTCTRAWPNPQVCTSAAPEAAKPAHRKH